MKGYTYTVEFEPDEEGGFVVTVPALPGCVTYGQTLEEAKRMAAEVITGWLEWLTKEGEPIPEETPPTQKLVSSLQVNVDVPVAV